MQKNTKHLAINMVAAMASYGTSLLINLLLSPYIVETIGVEANGFISLANNFISYASLLTIALNSMAGRFVTIEVERGNTDRANTFYSSALGANAIIATILAVVGGFCLVFLEHLITIPVELLLEVKILFGLVFLNFIIGIFTSTFSIATFATNKLHLMNMRQAESQVIYAVALLCGFVVMGPHVSMVGIATIVASVYTLVRAFVYRKTLFRSIKTSFAFVKLSAIVDMISSGIWNSVTKLGQILLGGLDLLIANIFMDSTAMGVLSIAKLIPQTICSLIGQLVSVFVPDLTIDYARGDEKSLIQKVRFAMKIMSLVTSVPVVGVLVMGNWFFELWMPGQDANYLHLLASLSLICLIVSGGVNIIYNVFTVVNKLKLNSVAVLVQGFISTVLVMILLRTTNWGAIAIVATSELLGLVRVLFFVLPYGAKCLDQKWYTFFPEALRPVFSATVCVIAGYGVKSIIPLRGWIGFLLTCVVVVVVILLGGYLFILNKEDRRVVKGMIMGKMRGKKNA